MVERYTKLSPLEKNLYTPGSPVVILAGSLLRDNETGKVLAQFKFRNISDNIIKALLVKVDAFDVSGKELPGVAEYQYLDLFASRGDEFGQKSAVTLPETITRSVKVQCVSAVFADDTKWVASENAEWSSLPTQQTVADAIGADLAGQYQRVTTTCAEYMLKDHEDLWLCACGSINRNEEAECHSCGYAKTELIQALDEESLTKGLNKHWEDMQAVAEEEEEEKAQSAAKSNKIRTGIIIGCATALIAFVILLFTVILPAQKATATAEYLDAVKEAAEEQLIRKVMDGFPSEYHKFLGNFSLVCLEETVTGNQFYMEVKFSYTVVDTRYTYYFEISDEIGSETFTIEGKESASP